MTVIGIALELSAEAQVGRELWSSAPLNNL